MTLSRVALTGATGVLGSALRKHNPAIDWLPFAGDIRDADAVSAWLRACGSIDAVIHLAALVPVVKVAADPQRAFAVNAGGTLNLVEAMRVADGRVPLFVASSSHVYSPAAAAIPEDAPREPSSLYGVTKLHAEQIALAYAREFGLPVCVGRIFSFSAPSQSSDYFLPATVSRIRNAPAGATLTIRGGHQQRDFLPTARIAAAILRLLQSGAGGAWNIGSGRGVTLLEVARTIAHRLGRDDLTFETDDPAAGSLIADSGKLQQLGWSPGDALAELVAEMAEQRS